MRIKMPFVLLSAVLGTVLTFSLTSKTSALPAPQSNRALEGQYFGYFDLGGGAFIPFVNTSTANGVVTQVDGTDLGLGGLVTENSTATGTYQVTGARQTTTDLAWIGYQDTLPRFVYRSRSVTQWSPGFIDGTGVATVRVYDLAAGEDPTDPAGGAPYGVFPYTLSKVVMN